MKITNPGIVPRRRTTHCRQGAAHNAGAVGEGAAPGNALQPGVHAWRFAGILKSMKKPRCFEKPPTAAGFDRLRHWALLLKEPGVNRAWPRFPYGDILRRRYDRLPGQNNANRPLLVTDLPNALGSRVALATVKPDQPAFEILGRARELVAMHRDAGPTELGLAVVGFSPKQAARAAEALLAAALAAAAPMPDYRRERERLPRLEQLRLYGAPKKHGFARTIAEDEGNALARRLTALPQNELTPGGYHRRIAALAAEFGWDRKFLSIAQLRKKKAGAFLAVAQGSPDEDGGIAHLRYRPARTGRAARKTPGGGPALVGKGICFDTGGVNLKPHSYMCGMHEDMGGSAVALGVLAALTRLRAPFPVDCWLAVCANHIGPGAYNPGDVVRAVDGTTIEVVHTDAEGRMVLADALALAARARPRLVIDYATLTGACVAAVGKAYSGVFTNRPAFLPALVRAGADSGERVWPFPMDADYDDALRSDIADVKQCGNDNNADHILGARFLQRFVKHDCPWIHVDLSASHHKGGLAHVPTNVTGFGVRFTLNLLLDQKVVDFSG